MKTPFHGKCKIDPGELPDSFVQECLRDNSPRYIWVQWDKPIRQIGHEFLYTVIPIKLTAKRTFKQCGRGVLCQTKEEAVESVELLSARAKEQFVVIQAAGFGSVGTVRNHRSIITEQSVRSRPGKDGKKQWWAFEREIDKATGEITVLRRETATNKTQAMQVAKRWLCEYEQKKKKYFDAVKAANTPPAPSPRCDPLTQTDFKEDLPKAKWTALRRQWPHTFEIFERRKAHLNINISDQECQDAYLLDLVEQGFDPKSKTIRCDLQLISALQKAADRFAKARKRRVIDLALYLIAFNWELGWCNMSDAEIAKKLTALLKTSFTPGQVKQFRSRTLGLVAKHWPGPTPKSS